MATTDRTAAPTGKDLRLYRRVAGVSATSVASAMGVSRARVNHISAREARLPVAAMASGGVVPNGPVIVGEERAEVFDPRRRRIYPDAGEWAREHSGGGGDTYEVTINNPEPRAADDDIGFALRRASFLGMGRPRRRAGAPA